VTLISPEQSTAWYEAKGRSLGEQDDDTSEDDEQ
jgi:hypothetical protein